MLHAVVARPPVYGGKVAKYDAEPALKVPGVVRAHAPMEPPAALARDRIARRLSLWVEDVTVNVTLLGGGFGRKSKPDFMIEAAVLSKAMGGAPIKVTWTREDDLRNSYYHTVAVEHLEVALDAEGKLIAWLHRTVAPTIRSTFAADARNQPPSELGMTAINMPFVIPNVRIENSEATAHTRLGWFRSVSNIHHAFAVQSFVAELAAAVVEVAVDAEGALAIPRVDIAVDCGAQINPEGVRAQMEGACVMGVSLAISGEISYKAGRVEQDNFHNYEITRMAAAPRAIHVHSVHGDFSAPLGGVGEPGLPPIAPALCNAIFAATGKRIRSLPIRDQLKKA